MFKSTGHTGKIDKIQNTLSEENIGKTERYSSYGKSQGVMFRERGY